ncbi:hypothetical protein Tco_1153692 [Tanacetum coccineum]
MELVLEQPEVESTDVLAPTPLHNVPSATVEPPRPDATSVGSSEDADVAEVDSGLKRRRATGDDGVGPSKRVRYPSLGLSTSTEEDTLDASPTLATKEVTETPPPNVEATSDSSAPVTHAAQSPPQTGPKAFEKSIQKDEEILLLLKTQLADAQAEAESSKSLRSEEPWPRKKWHCLSRTILLQVWDEFFARERKGLLEKQEEKLRKLSIEYDEELYPHMLSAIAERSEALARVRRSGEELHEKRLLTVPASQLERDQDYPIDVIMAGLTLARHASEGAEGQPDYFLKPDVRNCRYSRYLDCPPAWTSLNLFALEREIPLKESLEAHAIRLAKKKGVKGKAILCSVGAAHIPHSDRVPVSVATVLPKDSELLGKLEEAGDAAYQGFMMPDVDRYANPLTQTVPPFSRFTHPYPHRGLLGLGPPICPGLWRHASVIGCDIDLSVRIDGIPVRPTCDNSSTHLPLCLSRRALIPSPRLRFARSTKPLLCGCLTDVKRCVNQNGTHVYPKQIVLLIPCICGDRSQPTIHYKVSLIASIRNFNPPAATGKGPAMSISHLWNGHGEVMGVSSCCGWRRIGLCTWQSWHSYHDPRAVGSARWASSTQTSKAQVLLQIEVPSAYCITPAGITRST